MTKKDKTILAVIGLVAVVALVAGIYYFAFVPKAKVFSGINYYEDDIYVEINGEKIELNKYGTYSKELTTEGEVKLVAKKVSDNSVVSERTHNLAKSAGVAIDLWGEEESLKSFCMITADATDLYYDRKGTISANDLRPATLSEVLTKSDNTKISFYKDLGVFGTINNTTVYPGSYSIESVPDKIEEGSKVVGYYVIACDSTEDNEKITQWANFWKGLEEGYLDQVLDSSGETPVQ